MQFGLSTLMHGIEERKCVYHHIISSYVDFISYASVSAVPLSRPVPVSSLSVPMSVPAP